MSAHSAIWLDRFQSGLYCMLPGCTLSRHSAECQPGLWRFQATMCAHAMSFLGIWYPPGADAVVDDFGTLVRVP